MNYFRIPRSDTGEDERLNICKKGREHFCDPMDKNEKYELNWIKTNAILCWCQTEFNRVLTRPTYLQDHKVAFVTRIWVFPFIDLWCAEFHSLTSSEMFINYFLLRSLGHLIIWYYWLLWLRNERIVYKMYLVSHFINFSEMVGNELFFLIRTIEVREGVAYGFLNYVNKDPCHQPSQLINSNLSSRFT